MWDIAFCNKSSPATCDRYCLYARRKPERCCYFDVKRSKVRSCHISSCRLGRALAEVGAILIVGGNIAYSGSVGGIGEGLSYTRSLTTAITLEQAKVRYQHLLHSGSSSSHLFSQSIYWQTFSRGWNEMHSELMRVQDLGKSFGKRLY